MDGVVGVLGVDGLLGLLGPPGSVGVVTGGLGSVFLLLDIVSVRTFPVFFIVASITMLISVSSSTYPSGAVISFKIYLPYSNRLNIALPSISVVAFNVANFPFSSRSSNTAPFNSLEGSFLSVFVISRFPTTPVPEPEPDELRIMISLFVVSSPVVIPSPSKLTLLLMISPFSALINELYLRINA
ncbi:hypothetical protein D3C77_426780 [compost metagenome]